MPVCVYIQIKYLTVQVIFSSIWTGVQPRENENQSTRMRFERKELAQSKVDILGYQICMEHNKANLKCIVTLAWLAKAVIAVLFVSTTHQKT